MISRRILPLLILLPQKRAPLGILPWRRAPTKMLEVLRFLEKRSLEILLNRLVPRRRRNRKTPPPKAEGLFSAPCLSAALAVLFRDAVEMAFAAKEQLICDNRRRG